MPSPRLRSLISGLVSALVPLLMGAPASANDTSFSLTGGTPRVVAEKDVAMAAEKLIFSHVRPDPVPKPAGGCAHDSYEQAGKCQPESYWQADLSYTFVNRGPARTLTIGLPFDMPACDAEYDTNGPCLKQGVLGLSTSVDGVPFKVSARNVEISAPVAFNRVYLVTVPFAKGQTRVLRHRYQSYGITSIAGQRFRYILRTGSNWAGPIGRAEIAFELPPGYGPCATANLPHSYDGSWLRIDLKNWQPDRDLDIVFADPARALIGTGIFAWGETVSEVCDEAMALPAEERARLANQVELLYGAPAAGREEAFKIGPGPLCASADYFAMIANRVPDFMPHVGLQGLHFVPDPAFPAAMPAPVRECVRRLRL